ncbi:MAG: Methyl-accepting chemotaxis protein I [Luteibacter sp.]|uniref:methyl-accepting chemotaxis protein n=1 Tax=Luteibacter sp. TaxID=1886636 RepID=UPI00137E29B1|nr:methyl-accepting chemotaxis protein [Luteibacter sp.]KAF1004792.1 MAG: Methyl-accepting chemotaxis protein I [Luteibacter sp.]
MTLVRRLAAVLIAGLIALLAVGGYGLFELHAAQDRVGHLETTTLPGLQALSEAQDDVGALRLALYRYVVDGIDDAARVQMKQQIAELDSGYARHLASYAANAIGDAKDASLLTEDRNHMAAYLVARDTFFHRYDGGQRDSALDMLHDHGGVHDAALALNHGLHDHLAYVVAQADAQAEANASAYRSSVILTVLAIAIAAVGMGWFGGRLYRLIRGGLGKLQGTLQTVSSSLDLSLRADVDRHDEIGLTAEALNTLLARIADTVRTVQASSDTVHSVASHIVERNRDISERTMRQAAALEETTASVAELTEAARHTAERAVDASTVAGAMAEEARRSGRAVEYMGSVMQEISTHAQRIRDVTGVIESIAFQTNILALNAAVEAARAGGHGKGFAVVASEVRSLAQHSATSARDIKGLIERSVEAIENGVEQATAIEDSNLTLQASVARVATQVTAIGQLAHEQGRGTEQINQAMASLDSDTQRYAQMVDEAAEAVGTLHGQAQVLRDTAGIFTGVS